MSRFDRNFMERVAKHTGRSLVQRKADDPQAEGKGPMPIKIDDEGYYTLSEIGQLAQYSLDRLRRHVQQGRLKAFRSGRRLIVEGRDFRAWLLRDRDAEGDTEGDVDATSET